MKLFKTEKQIRIASITHWILAFVLSVAAFIVSGKLFPGHEQWISFSFGVLNLLVNKIARELPNGEDKGEQDGKG